MKDPKNQSSSTPTKRGMPGWAWALIAVGALLAIVGIIFIVFVVIGVTESTPKTGDQATTAATTTTPANDTSSLDTYLVGVTEVLNKITAAVKDWEAAAEAGKTGDIVASNAEVNKGIDKALEADKIIATLSPTTEATKLHSKLKEALALTHSALNKALLGNLNEDPDTIQKSKDAIQSLGTTLEELNVEIDIVTR